MSYSILETELDTITRLNREELKSREAASGALSAALAVALSWIFDSDKPWWLTTGAGIAIVFLGWFAWRQLDAAKAERDDRDALVTKIKAESRDTP